MDWDALAPHYRAGIRSLADMGAEFGVSDAAIIKHARKSGWSRNLKAKIEAKAAAKVSAAMVSAEVSAQTKVTEALTVEVEATVQARITLAQRRDVGRGRTLVMTLFSELEAQTSDTESLAALGVLLRKEDERGADKLNDLYQKIIDLPSRVDSVKKLSEALKTLVALEREAYGMDAKKGPVGGEGEINISF